MSVNGSESAHHNKPLQTVNLLVNNCTQSN